MNGLEGLVSNLIVGVPAGIESTTFQNAVACTIVDSVLPDVPKKVDFAFLKRHGVDFFVQNNAGDTKVTEAASDEVLSLKMCLVVGKDGKEASVAKKD